MGFFKGPIQPEGGSPSHCRGQPSYVPAGRATMLEAIAVCCVPFSASTRYWTRWICTTLEIRRYCLHMSPEDLQQIAALISGSDERMVALISASEQRMVAVFSAS